jgi:hypothetical protein
LIASLVIWARFAALAYFDYSVSMMYSAPLLPIELIPPYSGFAADCFTRARLWIVPVVLMQPYLSGCAPLLPLFPGLPSAICGVVMIGMDLNGMNWNSTWLD